MKELFEVTIEVTQRCPNRCIYCSSWSDINKSAMLDLQTIYGIVDDAAELGAKLINLSGGEPLLRPDIADIADYIHSKGLEIRLYSSGIFYDGSYKTMPTAILESIKGKVDHLIFNYESSTPEMYAKIMGTQPENMALLDETIKNSIEIGIPVEAHIVPMKCNFRQIPQTLEKLYEMGLSKVSLLRLVPQGRVEENEEMTILSAEEQNELTSLLESLSKKYDKTKLRLGKPQRTTKFSTCRTGTIRMVVRYDGLVFPCGAFKDGFMTFMGQKPVNINEKRLSAIYQDSEYLKSVRRELEKYYEGEVCEPCFGQYCRFNQIH